MGWMAESVSTLVKAMCEQSKAPDGNKELSYALRQAVQMEVYVELAHTNALIIELKALTVSSISRRHA